MPWWGYYSINSPVIHTLITCLFLSCKYFCVAGIPHMLEQLAFKHSNADWGSHLKDIEGLVRKMFAPVPKQRVTISVKKRKLWIFFLHCTFKLSRLTPHTSKNLCTVFWICHTWLFFIFSCSRKNMFRNITNCSNIYSLRCRQLVI